MCVCVCVCTKGENVFGDIFWILSRAQSGMPSRLRTATRYVASGIVVRGPNGVAGSEPQAPSHR